MGLRDRIGIRLDVDLGFEVGLRLDVVKGQLRSDVVETAVGEES
jgi:hypothetical protein